MAQESPSYVPFFDFFIYQKRESLFLNFFGSFQLFLMKPTIIMIPMYCKCSLAQEFMGYVPFSKFFNIYTWIMKVCFSNSLQSFQVI